MWNRDSTGKRRKRKKKTLHLIVIEIIYPNLGQSTNTQRTNWSFVRFFSTLLRFSIFNCRLAFVEIILYFLHSLSVDQNVFDEHMDIGGLVLSIDLRSQVNTFIINGFSKRKNLTIVHFNCFRNPNRTVGVTIFFFFFSFGFSHFIRNFSDGILCMSQKFSEFVDMNFKMKRNHHHTMCVSDRLWYVSRCTILRFSICKTTSQAKPSQVSFASQVAYTQN